MGEKTLHRFNYYKLVYSFLVLSFIINPFIYMGNLSRHDNLPAYPILIFKANPAPLYELQKTFAQLRLTPNLTWIKHSTAKYETPLPNFTSPFLNGLNPCALHLTLIVNFPPVIPFLGHVAEFSLVIKQIHLPFPDKPPTLAL